jgi:hypothetical protein
MTPKFARLMARLPTYWTYIREKPSWFFVLVGGRILFIRDLERRWRGARPVTLSAAPVTRLVVDGAEMIVEEMERDGVSRRVSLSAPDVQAIRDFADSTLCTTRTAPVQSFLVRDLAAVNARRPRDVIAAYYFESVRLCPAIVAIEGDPFLRDLAEAYIGTPPHHIRTRLWWSFPGNRVSDADLHAAAQNKYHFDLNGFRTVKFFFYITDVDAGAGPHAYVAGSHRHRRLRHQYTLMVGHEERELRDYYGDDQFVEVTGKAGTGFVEDPFLFHVGTSCRDRSRLLLEIEFGPHTASESYRYGVLG